MDAVLVLRPVVALAGATPGLDQLAVRIELQHRGRWHAAFRARGAEARRLLVVGERLWPLHHPDMVLSIDRDARRLPHDPVIRQRLRPARVDLELRRLRGWSGGRE